MNLPATVEMASTPERTPTRSADGPVQPEPPRSTLLSLHPHSTAVPGVWLLLSWASARRALTVQRAPFGNGEHR